MTCHKIVQAVIRWQSLRNQKRLIATKPLGLRAGQLELNTSDNVKYQRQKKRPSIAVYLGPFQTFLDFIQHPTVHLNKHALVLLLSSCQTTFQSSTQSCGKQVTNHMPVLESAVSACLLEHFTVSRLD